MWKFQPPILGCRIGPPTVDSNRFDQPSSKIKWLASLPAPLEATSVTEGSGSSLVAHSGYFVWFTKTQESFGVSTAGSTSSILSSEKLNCFWLVGGFNPSEKYARQNGNLPQIGMNIKNDWNLKPPPSELFFRHSLESFHIIFQIAPKRSPWKSFKFESLTLPVRQSWLSKEFPTKHVIIPVFTVTGKGDKQNISTKTSLSRIPPKVRQNCTCH